jgi:transcriptional regulator with XRE-family HTH domain
MRMITLGKNIRLLRQKKGWSQGDAAKKLDISIPAFSKIETGFTDINLSRLEQVASLFEMSAVDLLGLNEMADENRSAINIGAINKKISEREAEIIELQKKVIDLFEQLDMRKRE